ncbi:MAG: hypothetical protein KBG64_06880 [Clostridia bacterium]|nr:hypothetical protein [Clostridia bacterium]
MRRQRGGRLRMDPFTGGKTNASYGLCSSHKKDMTEFYQPPRLCGAQCVSAI